jgi:hypothetical protein
MKKALFAALALALSLGAFTTSEAGSGYQCPDVYDPVTCSNGQTYSNACYASLAGATGCVRGV